MIKEFKSRSLIKGDKIKHTVRNSYYTVEDDVNIKTEYGNWFVGLSYSCDKSGKLYVRSLRNFNGFEDVTPVVNIWSVMSEAFALILCILMFSLMSFTFMVELTQGSYEWILSLFLAGIFIKLAKDSSKTLRYRINKVKSYVG
jgi:hypothetical protein